MHIKYDKAAIDPSLPGILLLSHGDLAIGLMDTVQAVIGTTSNIAAFTLSHEDDPSRYQEAFLSAANSFPEGSVILLDVFGGTPCTRLLLSAQEFQRQLRQENYSEEKNCETPSPKSSHILL